MNSSCDGTVHDVPVTAGKGGWPDHLVVGSRSDRKPRLPHPITKQDTISGDSLQAAGLRIGSFVEIQEPGGPGDCRAVPQLACLPRSGASMAHPVDQRNAPNVPRYPSPAVDICRKVCRICKVDVIGTWEQAWRAVVEGG
jgi:hypothetical protein